MKVGNYWSDEISENKKNKNDILTPRFELFLICKMKIQNTNSEQRGNK